MADNVEAFLREFAPDDVQATIAWLLDHGYELPPVPRSLSIMV